LCRDTPTARSLQGRIHELSATTRWNVSIVSNRNCGATIMADGDTVPLPG
jgi:hypothetical protein